MKNKAGISVVLIGIAVMIMMSSMASAAVIVTPKCGTTVNTCVAGTFYDVADTSTKYLWGCKGISSSASCSMIKSPVCTVPQIKVVGKAMHGTPKPRGTIGLMSGTTEMCNWVQMSSMGTLLGLTNQYGYFMRIDWCYNGMTITSTSKSVWSESYLIPGFVPRGEIASSTSGGVGKTSYTYWSKGKFSWVVLGCNLYDFYPWIQINVYKDGTYSQSAG